MLHAYREERQIKDFPFDEIFIFIFIRSLRGGKSKSH